MEAVTTNSTGGYNHRNLYSYPSDDLLLSSYLAGGYFAGANLFSMPPATTPATQPATAYLSHSYPPAGVGFRPPQNQFHRQQLPLLPLPISIPLNHHNMNIYRSNSSSNNIFRSNNRSSPPRNNKNAKNRARDHSLTPKKSKNQKKNLTRNEPDLAPPATAEVNEAPAEVNGAPAEVKEAPAVPESSIKVTIGPDLIDLRKNVISRVLRTSIDEPCDFESVSVESVDVDKFSGAVVFTPSPPPSSLPLPTFSLRRKISCTAEAAVAAGVDAGATDSLRRLLRL